MEKYGFVYIWYDKKRKMYYIGSHWGTIDDGYICSSNRMRNVYKRRPKDFKRRILKTNINRLELLNEEHKWLSKISEIELGIKYYNLKNSKFNHWTIQDFNRLSIGQKISNSPDRRLNISKAMKGRKPHILTVEANRKKRLGKSYDEIFGTEKANQIKEIKREKMKIYHKNRKSNI